MRRHSDVTNEMAIAREEIFGPVLSIITYHDTEEAICIANDTLYGLQAYVFSADAKRAHDVASRIDAGRVLVNTLAHEPAAANQPKLVELRKIRISVFKFDFVASRACSSKPAARGT